MTKPFLLIGAILSAPSLAADLTPAQIFRAASPSIVVVESYDEAGNSVAQGSGVSIADQQVVTNCHVFKDAVSAKVVYQARSLEASLRHSDPDRDLCTLLVPGLDAPAAKFGNTASLQVGERAYAIGAPQGFTLTLTDGLISSLRPMPGGVHPRFHGHLREGRSRP
jgi:S1-C subfamily serine protease